jgi:lipase chaperone LimK
VRPLLWLAAAASLAVWIGLHLAGPPVEEALPPVDPPRQAPPVRVLPPPVPSVETAPAPASLPRSLAGTQVDGDLELGEDGHFVADRRTRQLFEYFLATEGEEDAAAIRRRVVAEAAARLPPDEAPPALALFDRYLAYREALADALSSVPRGDLRGAFAIVHALRIARFGPDDARRLFGDDERLAQEALARLP